MIQITELKFGYEKKKLLFDKLTCTEEAGSIVGLLGKNGAGKTTLLKLISGLLEAPGKCVRVMDEIPFKRKPSFLEEVYFVTEEYELPSVKIDYYTNIFSPFYPRFDREKLTKILNEFELSPGDQLNKLSQGQRKKFVIAFALATNCRLLLLDEPTNGLDIPSKAIFRKVMAGALTDNQLVIISTHQVKDVENLIDKIILIDQGKIVLHESIWSITENFTFTIVPNLNGTTYLYNEQTLGGFKVVLPAQNTQSEVDIELLFNAAVSGVNFNTSKP